MQLASQLSGRTFVQSGEMEFLGGGRVRINITPTFETELFVVRGGRVFLVRDFVLGRMRKTWFLEFSHRVGVLERVDIGTLDRVVEEGRVICRRMT